MDIQGIGQGIGTRLAGRLEVTQASAGPRMAARQMTGIATAAGEAAAQPRDTIIPVHTVEELEARRQQAWATGHGYAMAARIRMGDWSMVSFAPAGASKDEIQEIVDQEMALARQIQAQSGGREVEIEFRFADPDSVTVEQSVVQVTAQTAVSVSGRILDAAQQQQDSAAGLAAMLRDFLKGPAGDAGRETESADGSHSRKRTASALFAPLDVTA